MGKPGGCGGREGWPVLPRGCGAVWEFGISTAINWSRRMRETGSVAPGQMGGHKPKAIAERIKADFTLRGLVAELAERGLRSHARSGSS